MRSNESTKKPKIIMQPRKKAQSAGQTLYCKREIATRALLGRSAAMSRLFFIAPLNFSGFPCFSWTRFYCPSSEYAFFHGYVGIRVFFREYGRLFRDEIVENRRFKLISFRAYVRAYSRNLPLWARKFSVFSRTRGNSIALILLSTGNAEEPKFGMASLFLVLKGN